MPTPVLPLEIRRVANGKRDFLPLLLLGDESEEMIDRYLGAGTLYAGYSGEEPVAICVVTDAAPGIIEVKNLAVSPDRQRRGYGRQMLSFVEELYREKTVQLGTGEAPSTMLFYQACGYTVSHRVADFFTDNYPHPIIEDGVMLRDMVYLRKAPAIFSGN